MRRWTDANVLFINENATNLSPYQWEEYMLSIKWNASLKKEQKTKIINNINQILKQENKKRN